MTMTFLVASAAVPTMMPLKVQGEGINSVDARRAALHIARTLKCVPNPVVIGDHGNRAAAEMIRRWAAEEARRRVAGANLNGRGKPFWQLPDDGRYRRN